MKQEEKFKDDVRTKNEIIAFVEQSIHRGGGTPIPQEQENKWIAWLEKQVEPLNESVYDTEDKEIYQAISIGLTDVFNEFGWSDFGGIPIENIQNWLEKQGEHANFRNKIQIGDKVTRNEDGVLVNLSQLKRVAKKDEKQGGQKPTIEMKSAEESLGIDSETYNKIVDECIYGEKKPVVIIPKFRVGDEIKTQKEESLIITKIDDKGYWSEDLFICDFDEECIWDLVEQKPAWSEEDEEKVKAMCEDGNLKPSERAWLKSLKNRVQPQPKQEWSEEDESMLYGVIETEQYMLDVVTGVKTFDVGNEQIESQCTKELAWLKILKDRCTWKPSDEQMDALHYVTNFDYGGYKATLVSLYEQLKKLKGE